MSELAGNPNYWFAHANAHYYFINNPLPFLAIMIQHSFHQFKHKVKIRHSFYVVDGTSEIMEVIWFYNQEKIFFPLHRRTTCTKLGPNRHFDVG